MQPTAGDFRQYVAVQSFCEGRLECLLQEKCKDVRLFNVDGRWQTLVFMSSHRMVVHPRQQGYIQPLFCAGRTRDPRLKLPQMLQGFRRRTNVGPVFGPKESMIRLRWYCRSLHGIRNLLHRCKSEIAYLRRSEQERLPVQPR